MDLATMTAAPAIVQLGGKSFRIGPLAYFELGMIQRYLNDATPAGEKPPPVGDDHRWIEALFSGQDGIAFFLNLLFSKHQDLPDVDLVHVLKHIGPGQIQALFRIAMDQEEEPASPEGRPAPKGEAAPSTT